MPTLLPLESAPADAFADRLEPVEDLTGLLEATRSGDPLATYKLLELVRPHLERLAHGYTRGRGAHESTSDLVQEAWLRAWQRLDQFTGGSEEAETLARFRAWVGRIVHRLGLNRQRDAKAWCRSPRDRKVLPFLEANPSASPGGELPVVLPDSAIPTPSACVSAEEETALIQAAVAQLPGREEREIIRLRFFEGQSLRQAAFTLGMTYDRARERYAHALEILERHLA